MHFQWIFLGTLNTNLFQLLNVNFYITLKCKIISYDNGSCKIPSLEGRTQHILPSVGKRINPLSILYNLCILLLKIKKSTKEIFSEENTSYVFKINWIVVLEKTLKSPLDCKEIQPVHPKGNQSWLFTGKTDAEVEIPILWSPDAKNWTFHWKRPWCWERFKAGGERVDRGWDGWMASPTQWTWVWVNSGNWWGTGRPGVLQFMGLQRVGHDWATELNWTEIMYVWKLIKERNLN